MIALAIANVTDLFLECDHIQIQDFMEGMKEHPNHSNGLLDPPKALADIVESVLGAIFMDSDSSLETVWKVQTLRPPFPTFLPLLSRMHRHTGTHMDKILMVECFT